MLYISKSGRLFLISLIITISFLTTLHTVNGAEEKMDEKKGIMVKILLFSGRPDPAYVLEDKNLINRLKTLITAAKVNEKFEKNTVIPSILGYKGIIVDNPAQFAGLPTRFAVYRGNIEIKNERKKFLMDEGGAIENLLLNQAIEKKVIPEEAVKRIKLRTVK